MKGVKRLLIIKLWNYFRGYVIIQIEGLSLEKFINYAIARGIYLWDVIRVDYTTLEAKVGLKGYKELRHIVKKAGCKIKINTKIGYPFFMHKIRLRKMILGGFIICLFIVVLSTSFIWNIQIVGNKNISEQEVEKVLKTLGLAPGTIKYRLDLPEIENGAMIKLDNLAWVGIEIKGTKAIIEVVEKIKAPEKIPMHTPCDIIAIKKGIVEKVIAKNGDASVQKGDIVKEGQILITGSIAREELDTRYVHALGEVLARTYYEESDKMDLITIRKVKTGNKFTKRIIKIGNSQILLSLGKMPYKNVILEKKNKSLSNWRNIKIPVEIIIEEYYEVIPKTETIHEKAARKALYEKLLVKLMNKVPKDGKVLNKDIQFYKKNNKMEAKLTLEVLEQIGKQRHIVPTY